MLTRPADGRFRFPHFFHTPLKIFFRSLTLGKVVAERKVLELPMGVCFPGHIGLHGVGVIGQDDFHCLELPALDDPVAHARSVLPHGKSPRWFRLFLAVLIRLGFGLLALQGLLPKVQRLQNAPFHIRDGGTLFNRCYGPKSCWTAAW